MRFADLVPALLAAIRRAALAGMVPVLVFYGLLKTLGPVAGIAGSWCGTSSHRGRPRRKPR